MSERKPQTSEQVNIHERGSLTPAHWQEVIKRLPPWRNFAGATGLSETKLYVYAWNVIEGEFAGTQDHHQEYLGSRHWSNVLAIFEQVEVRTPRKIGIFTLPLLTEVDLLATERAKEVKNYASLEKNARYTLNDYVFGLHLGVLCPYNWWDYYEPHIYSTDAYYIDEYSDSRLTSGRPSEIWLKSNKERIDDENELLRIWLLTKEEVKNLKDPLRTSPQALEIILRDRIPVEVLNQRLRAVLDELGMKFQSVGGWEKKI